MIREQEELSSQASQVWNGFWRLPDEERDIVLARLMEASSMTLVVGGDSNSRGNRGNLRVIHRNDVTSVIGTVVNDRGVDE